MEAGTITSLHRKSLAQKTVRGPGLSQAFGWYILQLLPRACMKNKLKPREGKSTQGVYRSSSSIFPVGALLSLLQVPPGGGEAQTGHISACCTPPWFCWEGGERLPPEGGSIFSAGNRGCALSSQWERCQTGGGGAFSPSSLGPAPSWSPVPCPNASLRCPAPFHEPNPVDWSLSLAPALPRSRALAGFT